MNKSYVYSIVFMVVGLFSCENEAKPIAKNDDKDGVAVTVSHSAGDNWEEEDNFLPLPFNVAQRNETDVIVLSERIEKGKHLKIRPIGAVRLLQNDSLRTYVVSIPSKSDFASFATSDFDEFSTVHSSAKWIIEQYLLNRKGSYSTKLKSWENENFAINYLLK